MTTVQSERVTISPMPPQFQTYTMDIITYSNQIMTINTHGMTSTANHRLKKVTVSRPVGPIWRLLCVNIIGHVCTCIMIALMSIHFRQTSYPLHERMKLLLDDGTAYHDLFSSYHDCTALTTSCQWHRSHPYGHPKGYISHHNPTAPIIMTALYLLHFMKQVLLLVQRYTGLMSRLHGVHIKTVMIHAKLKYMLLESSPIIYIS